MAPHFSSGKISICFFSKWNLGSYKTQTVNFKPMLCRYLHSNMLKTLIFFNIWRKNLKIQKWSSEIMSRLQKFSENNFKWWGLWCWKNHVHISSGYENICIWSSRRLLKTTLYRKMKIHFGIWSWSSKVHFFCCCFFKKRPNFTTFYSNISKWTWVMKDLITRCEKEFNSSLSV